MRVNLHTSDLVVAQRRRLFAVADFSLLLETAKRRAEGKQDALADEAAQYADWVRQGQDDATGEDGEPDRAEIVADLLEGRLEKLEAERGEAVASRFYRTATNQKNWTDIDEHLEAYIAEHPAKPHTHYKRRQVVSELKKWRSTLTVEAITDQVARAFVEEVLAPGVSAATLNGKLGDLSSYWKWMIKRGRVSKGTENLWSNHRRKKVRKAPDQRERAFTSEEITALFKGKPERQDLADMMLLGALTGARLDELGRLKVRHVNISGNRLHIPGTKTDAALREIPLHPLLTEMLARRTKGKRGEDWVFHELPDRKATDLKPRSSPLSKAFTRYRRELGVGGGHGEESAVDFHSFRRWLASELRTTGTPGEIIDRICGWEGGSMRDRYTWSADTFELAKQAVERVRLPL